MFKKLIIFIVLIISFVNSYNLHPVHARYVPKERGVDGNGPAHWIISMKNLCDKEQKIAFRYRDMEGLWVTKGWFVLPPEPGLIEIKSGSQIFYYHVKDYVDNDSTPDAIKKTIKVSGNDFEYTKANPLKVENQEVMEVTFTTLSADQDYEYSECD